MTTTEDTDAGTDIVVHDPATGELVGRVRPAGPDEVADAVDRAIAARREWARTPAADRAGLVRDAAGAVRARAEELARLNETETGRPYDDGLGGVLAAAGTLEQYAELGPLHRGRSLHGQLVGDRPDGPRAARHGRRDHAVERPGGRGRRADRRRAGHRQHRGAQAQRALPAPGPGVRRPARVVPARGVLEVVDGAGPTGAALAGNAGVDVVAHVGSVAAGRAILQATAGTGARVLRENGGNDALVIDADVDPRWAAEQAALGSYANGGQVCVSVERIYCAAPVAEAFLAALTAEAARWVYRPSAPGEKALGPLVDRRHREHVHGHVAAALADGARVHAGGVVPDGAGAFYPATVLSGLTPSMAILREETFGPVAGVRVVDDFAQGLAEAIDDPHGLAATVLTGDMAHAQRAWRELPVGHRQDQRGVRRGAGRSRRAAPRLGGRVRLRPGAPRRDDHHEGRALGAAARLTADARWSGGQRMSATSSPGSCSRVRSTWSSGSHSRSRRRTCST